MKKPTWPIALASVVSAFGQGLAPRSAPSKYGGSCQDATEVICSSGAPA